VPATKQRLAVVTNPIKLTKMDTSAQATSCGQDKAGKAKFAGMKSSL